jgi:hypothetical protein
LSGVFSEDLGCVYKHSEHLRQQMGPTQHAELRQRAEHLFLTNEDSRLHLCCITQPKEWSEGNRKKEKRPCVVKLQAQFIPLIFGSRFIDS